MIVEYNAFVAACKIDFKKFYNFESKSDISSLDASICAACGLYYKHATTVIYDCNLVIYAVACTIRLFRL